MRRLFIKPDVMICNGINFTDAWVMSFATAEAFADHRTCQRYINLKMVERKILIIFYQIVCDKHKPKSHDVNSGVQEQVQEDRTEISNSGNRESESGSDSGSAGDTNEQGRKGKRKTVPRIQPGIG